MPNERGKHHEVCVNKVRDIHLSGQRKANPTVGAFFPNWLLSTGGMMREQVVAMPLKFLFGTKRGAVQTIETHTRGTTFLCILFCNFVPTFRALNVGGPGNGS